MMIDDNDLDGTDTAPDTTPVAQPDAPPQPAQPALTEADLKLIADINSDLGEDAEDLEASDEDVADESLDAEDGETVADDGEPVRQSAEEREADIPERPEDYNVEAVANLPNTEANNALVNSFLEHSFKLG